MSDSTTRFSTRVENYVRYRPHYPSGFIELLRTECALTAESVVADVGSGTGILSELFLASGNVVYGVEPNAEMRAAAESAFSSNARFRSVNATAEQSGLPDNCADFVTAGQAFHWFNRHEAQREFRRILRPAGWVVLVWNERAANSSPFGDAYEQLLLDYGTDYEAVKQRSPKADQLAEFFTNGYSSRTLANSQLFDFEGLRGRLLSSSYAPEAGHPQHDGMLAALRRVFDMHEQNGRVTFEYDTNVYLGRV